ncbi:MAG: hypothetical protein ACFHU9_10750 [Fluviicola sp.]
MSINQFYIATVFMLLFSQNGISQSGYLGKVRSAEIGLSTNIGFFDFLPTQEKLVMEETMVLSPKIELGYQIIRRRTAYKFSTKYSVLPNVEQYSTTSTYNPQLSQTRSDTSRMRSDVFGISFNFRKFLNVAPIGWYVQFGFGIDAVNNKSIHSSYISTEDFTQQMNTYSETHVVKNNLVFLGEIPLAIGKVIPIGRSLTLDIGLRSSVTMADFRYDQNAAYDLKVSTTQKWVNMRSFLSYNLLGIYAGIQIFH